MCYPEGDDLDRPVDLKALISEDYAVREGKVAWQDYCTVQFLGVRTDEACRLAEVFPEVKMLAGMGGSERRGIVVPASSNTRPQELSVPMLGQGGGSGAGGLSVNTSGGISVCDNVPPGSMQSQPATGPSLGMICCGNDRAAPMSARSGSRGHDSHMSSPHSGGPPPPAPPAVPACKVAPRPPRSRSRSAPGSEQGETPISAMELITCWPSALAQLLSRFHHILAERLQMTLGPQITKKHNNNK